MSEDNFWKNLHFLDSRKEFHLKTPTKKRSVVQLIFQHLPSLHEDRIKSCSSSASPGNFSWSGSSHLLRPVSFVCWIIRRFSIGLGFLPYSDSHESVYRSELWLRIYLWCCGVMFTPTPTKQFIIRYKRICRFMFRFGKFWASCI